MFAVWAASWVLLLAACGHEGPAGYAERETLNVDLAVSPRGIEIRGVAPVSRHRLARHHQALTALEYRLLDQEGQLVVSARAPDFRWAFSESVDRETGAFSRKDFRLLSAVGTIRLPAVAGELVVLEPRAGGAVELGRAAFDPEAAAAALRRPLEDDAVLGDPMLVAGGGGKEGSIDVLLLPEAYKEEQLVDFHQTAARFAEQLTHQVDFADHSDRLNVWYLDVRSEDDQIDEDGWFGDDHETAFDGQWGGGGFIGIGDVDENQIAFGDGDAARDLGEEHEMDSVVIIANVDHLRGYAGDDYISLGREDDGATLAHELGHYILDLGDEYTEFDGGFEGFRCGVHSFFGLHERVNVRSTVLDLTWWDLLTPGVELPTPEDAPWETVGAFEGANRCDSGWYRPEHTCLMQNQYSPMCAVCRRELDRFMDGLSTSPPGCPEEWRGDGICDLCLDDDPDCEVATVCDSDGTCDPKEHCSACPEDCGDCPVGGACGDGACSINENDTICPADCGCSEGAQCTNGPAPFGCWCDPQCAENGDCCADVDLESCS